MKGIEDLINLQKQIADSILGFATSVKLAKEVVIKMSTQSLSDGTKVEIDDNTYEVFSINEDGSRGDLVADGSYTKEDGTVFNVVSGKIQTDSEIEDQAPEQSQDEPALNEMEVKISELETQLSQKDAEIVSLKEKLDAYKAEAVKMSKESEDKLVEFQSKLEQIIKENKSSSVELSNITKQEPKRTGVKAWESWK